MLLLFLISIVLSKNIIKNPSFAEVDSNNKVLDWHNPNSDKVEISQVSHSGKKSPFYKFIKKLIYIF